jgi:hypothetical protein
MRAIIQESCSDNLSADNVRGIIRYDTSSTDDPTSTAWASAATDDCDDEDMSLLVPYLALAASDSPDEEDDFAVAVVVGTNGVLVSNDKAQESLSRLYIASKAWPAMNLLKIADISDSGKWAPTPLSTSGTTRQFCKLMKVTTLGLPNKKCISCQMQMSGFTL